MFGINSTGDLLRAVWYSVTHTNESFGSEKVTMQKIDKPGMYQGTWGSYQLELNFHPTGNIWTGYVLLEGKPLDSSPNLKGSAEVITFLAHSLEKRGCSAFVGGKKFSLKDFLSFTPAMS